MKIGVLGTGVVGKKIGAGLIKVGHEVRIGAFDDAGMEQAKKWVGKNGERASEGTFAEAAVFGELVLVAIVWTGCENAIKLAGPENFSGKVVIDVTNPVIYEEEGKCPSRRDIKRRIPDAPVGGVTCYFDKETNEQIFTVKCGGETSRDTQEEYSLSDAASTCRDQIEEAEDKKEEREEE